MAIVSQVKKTRKRRADPPTDMPPHSLEAEQAVLGSMLLDRDAVARAVEGLRPEDFYRDAHRVIFTAMIELFERGEPVDLITLTNRLAVAGKIEDVGGATYLASLPNVVPTAANWNYYADIVREKRDKRNLLAAGQLLQHSAMDGRDAASALATARTLLEDVERRQTVPVLPAGPAPDLGVFLNEVAVFLSRFVAFASPHQTVACALWAAHTHVYDRFNVSPFLHVSSPEKRSGKTRLLEVLELLVRSPWRVISPSEAVLFRKIDVHHPTLLLDETDTIFRRGRDDAHEPLRALLNAGNRRGVTIPRCVGDGAEIRLVEFDVFTPRVLAGIGELPDTVSDRSIPIRLQRRAAHEVVERFQARSVAQEAKAIRAGWKGWALRASEDLGRARPQVPSVLNDRAAELWEPLLVIADLAGEDWSVRAREAAIALHSGPQAQDETVGVVTLQAVIETIEAHGTDRLPTKAILGDLVKRDDGPWAEWWGRAVAAGDFQGPAARLAKMLKPFGVVSKTIRLPGEDTIKGYVLVDFTDARARYCPPGPVDTPRAVTSVTTQGNQGPARDSGGVTDLSAETMPSHRRPAQDKGCDAVTARVASGGGGHAHATPNGQGPDNFSRDAIPVINGHYEGVGQDQRWVVTPPPAPPGVT